VLNATDKGERKREVKLQARTYVFSDESSPQGARSAFTFGEYLNLNSRFGSALGREQAFESFLLYYFDQVFR
jgi:hypothetical protein